MTQGARYLPLEPVFPSGLLITHSVEVLSPASLNGTMVDIRNHCQFSVYCTREIT